MVERLIVARALFCVLFCDEHDRVIEQFDLFGQDAIMFEWAAKTVNHRMN